MTDHAVGAAAAVAVELVADPLVGQRWGDPSVLEGYRVGGLAAHLIRAIENVRTYVESDPPGADVDLVDAAGYFAAALADHHPITSDLHVAVRARGESRVEAGHAVLVADAGAALTWLQTATLDLDRPVRVLDGIAIRLGAYLDTRLLEITIHCDDLAASIGRPTPTFDDEAWRIVAGVLTELTLLRFPPAVVATTLARPDRYPPLGAFGAVDQK
jgi:hypothetical protein